MISTVYRGNCDMMQSISTWSHLGLNILGTILLAVGNNYMQCLSAPTRRDLDRVHPQGKWMDVGVQGFRNLLLIPRKRWLVWSFLCPSSLPLHLL